MTETVGLVGVGIMGSAMARNLIRAGFSVVGYDPSSKACDHLWEIGGQALNSPRAVADIAPIILTSLPNETALAEVIGGAGGLAGSEVPGRIVVECSTLPLTVKQSAHRVLSDAGHILLDCPVSGTGAQAVTKDLVIFGSGDRSAFDRSANVFAGISRKQHYLGAFGNGSIMKYLANHLVTIHNVAAAEAMFLGMRAGLDPALVYETLADSAGSSRMFQIRGPLMRDGTYDAPTATIVTHLKDIGIINGFVAALGCTLPVYAAATQFYMAGKALDLGGCDTAAVCTVLETLHGLDPADHRPAAAAITLDDQ